MLTSLWILAVLVGVAGARLRQRVAAAHGLPRIAVAARRRLGRARCCRRGSTLALAVAFVAARDPARSSRRCAARSSATRVLAAFRKVLPPMSQTEREAIEAGTVWWDGELFSRQARLDEAARAARADAHAPRSSASSTTRSRSCARMVDDWEITQRLPGPAAARLAVHQGQGLPRDDHPEGVRRPGLLRVRAFAGGHEAVDALAAPRR